MQKLLGSLFIMKTFKTFIDQEKKQAYFQELMGFIDYEYQTKTIFPPKDQIYSCLNACDQAKIRVVILGQDPYHEFNQANGLAFSVNKGVKIPPSLRNIYKELNDDVGCPIPSHGDLTSWAKQGVLLLNTVLTVQEGKANSHQKRGWEVFTDNLIKYIASFDQPLVFILWGKNAQEKAKIIGNKHLIIKSNHPSPLSAYRGFFGSRPFSKTNEYLIKNGLKPIDWEIKDV